MKLPGITLMPWRNHTQPTSRHSAPTTLIAIRMAGTCGRVSDRSSRAASVGVAHHARDRPVAPRLPPHMEKLEGAAVFRAILHVTEAMRSDLNGTVPFDRIHLEAPGYEVAPELRRL